MSEVEFNQTVADISIETLGNEDGRTAVLLLARETLELLIDHDYPPELHLNYLPDGRELSELEYFEFRDEMVLPPTSVPSFVAQRHRESYDVAALLPFPSQIHAVGFFAAQYTIDMPKPGYTGVEALVSSLGYRTWDRPKTLYNPNRGLNDPKRAALTAVRGLTSTLAAMRQKHPFVNGRYSWSSGTE